jgi:hypothetical protein
VDQPLRKTCALFRSGSVLPIHAADFRVAPLGGFRGGKVRMRVRRASRVEQRLHRKPKVLNPHC